MRALLIVVVVACGGGGTPPAQAPVANTTPVTAAPPPPAEPASTCGCVTEECHAADEQKYVFANVCTYRDRMCGCKDKGCGDAANADFTHWMDEMAKSARNKAPQLTEADAKRIADTVTQYQECYTKLSEPTP
jgi:hypothetical protein